MGLERLDQMEADGETGIEARRRLLEDHGDVLADDLPALALADPEKIAAVEGHAVRRHLGRPRQQAHDCQHGDRLSRTRFAHHRQDLAGVHFDRDVVDGAEQSASGLEIDAQVFDLEESHQPSFTIVGAILYWGRRRPDRRGTGVCDDRSDRSDFLKISSRSVRAAPISWLARFSLA